MKLVEAQEGRRILDRLVGWETSPVLVARVRSRAGRVGRTRAERRGADGRRARTRTHAVPLRAVARSRGRRSSRHDQAFRGRARRARRQAPRRRPRLRSGNRRRSRRPRPMPARSCCSTPTPPPHSPTRLRDAPFAVTSRRVGSVHRAAARAVHDVDAAAGIEPQAAVRCGAHDVDRAAALRARLHHLHANRQHQPVGAGGHRGTRGDPRAVRRGVPARRAAHVSQQGEERAGGPRSDPARRRSHPHARSAAVPSSTPTSSVSTS